MSDTKMSRTLEITGSIVGGTAELRAVKIKNEKMKLERNSLSWTATVPNRLGNGPWPLTFVTCNGGRLNEFSIDYRIHKRVEGVENRITVVGLRRY
jgi:hypothetical protein